MSHVDAEQIVQECGAGLVRVRRTTDGLAFAAPPLVRSGDVDEQLVERIAGLLRIDRGEIVDSQWVDNGPGWVAVLLRDAEAVLALEPGYVDIDLGVVGPVPGRFRGGLRGARVLSQVGSDGRGSGDG